MPSINTALSLIASWGRSCMHSVVDGFWWLGKQVVWQRSATQAAVQQRQGGSSWDSMTQRSSHEPITVKVTANTTPTIKERLCYAAVARALVEFPPSNLPSDAKKQLDTAYLYLDIITHQPVSTVAKRWYKDQALVLTQQAIAKCPQDLQEGINNTLNQLRKKYDETSKTLQEAKEEGIDLHDVLKNVNKSLVKEACVQCSLIKCSELRTKLTDQNKKSDLKKYELVFKHGAKQLSKAEEFYSKGQVASGNTHYVFAYIMLDSPRYMGLREKLGMRTTRVSRPWSMEVEKKLCPQTDTNQDYYLEHIQSDHSQGSTQKKDLLDDLEASCKATSVEDYERLMTNVEKRLAP